MIADRYELVEQLGDALWRARDTDLGREVSVRLLGPGEHTTPAAARLTHPSIAQLFDHGEWEGQRYEVLEFVPGETLAARLEREPLTEPEAERLGQDLTEALAYAHAAGVAHGALSADKVVVDTHGRAKLRGFGGGEPAEDERALAALLAAVGANAVPAPPDEESTRIVAPAPRERQRRSSRPFVLLGLVALALAGVAAAAYVASDAPTTTETTSTSSGRVDSITTGTTAADEPIAPAPAPTTTTTEPETTTAPEPTTAPATTAPAPPPPGTTPAPAPVPTTEPPTEPTPPPTTTEEPPPPPTTTETTPTTTLP